MTAPLRPPVHRLELPDALVAVSGSPDASRAVIGGAAGGLWIVNAQGELLARLPGHADGLFQAAWQPGGPWIASSGQDAHARVWNPETGAEVGAIPGGTEWVEQLAWSPSGEWLAIGAGRTLTLWHRERGVVHTLRDHRNTLSAIAWRPDSQTVAAACYGGVHLYDVATATRQGILPWKTSMLSLAWAPDQRWVVAGTQDLAVQVWPYPFTEGAELAMSGYEAKVRELAWHPSGRYLATGGASAIMVWNCSGNGPAGTTPRMLDAHMSRVSALAYQHRGHVLASGGLDGQVFLWNAGKSSKPLLQSTVGSAVTAITATADDRQFIAVAHNGTVAWIQSPA